MSVLNSANGKLYAVALGSDLDSAGSVTSGNWYRIKSVASTGSGLPSNLTSGDIFYQRSDTDPVTSDPSTGDMVQLLTLTTLGFVTDVSMSISKEKFDETVQTDDVRSYQVSSKPEKTGSISGYWAENDSNQQAILKRLDTVVEHTTTGGVTRTSPQTSVNYLMLSRDESTAAAVEVWEWLPCIVEGVQSDKPMEGPMSFNFNYTAKGSENPQTYILDK